VAGSHEESAFLKGANDMKKWSAFCLTAALSVATIAPATLTLTPAAAQAATIDNGAYTVQVAPYYKGELSKNTQANMNSTAQLTVQDGVETVKISLLNGSSYQDIIDENGNEIPLERHADGTATLTVSGKDVIANGIQAKFHIVVAEINYDHYYDMNLKFDASTLISTAAPKTKRTLTATATNRVAKSDTVTVKGVKKGDTVRVSRGSVVLATTTATSSTAKLSVKQLGKKAGKIAITAQAAGEQESVKKRIAFKAEPVSKAVSAKNVTITNKKGKANDKVVVKGLKKGDVVKFYDTLGNGLGRVSATSSTATFKLKSLKAKGGKLVITRTEAGKNTSAKVKKSYQAEK